MFDDAIDPYDVGMRELSRRLEAFADTRLEPSLSGTSRMRTHVMNTAHRRAALMAADRAFDAAPAATTAEPARAAGGSRFASRAWRRPMAALMAGAMMLAFVGGTASAANAGGPLYAARIWVEMANLPAGALARADAEVSRLNARLREARQASSKGDGPAAEAALAAYSVILSEAVDRSAADPDATAAIETNLTRHVAALTVLGNDAPSTAQDAIRRALSSSSMVLQELDDAIVHESGGLPGDGLSGTGQTGPTGPTDGKPVPPANGPGAAPGAGAAPDVTTKPAKTAAPDRGGHGHGNSGTPPGHADPKRPRHSDPTARPTHKPPSPKSGGT